MRTVELLMQRIELLRRIGPAPVLVALDGRSGAGKSTLAAAVGARAEALVIDGDDFYSGGSDEYWDSVDAQHQMDLVIDWRRQRAVLELLRRGRPATWRPYDWDADNGGLGEEITAGPIGVIILEGAYSSRPELADLFAMRVLLETDRDVRRDRLFRREGERYRDEWEARWGAAEDLYFRTVMPPSAFDLVLDGSDGW